MIRNIIIFFLLFSFIGLIKAQESSNSISKNDSLIIHLYIDSLSEVVYTDIIKAESYLKSIETLSLESNYNRGMYIMRNSKGIMHYMQGRYEESILDYQAGLQYTNPNKPEEKIRLYSNISLSYKEIRNYDSALYYLDLMAQLADKYQLQDVYMNTFSIRGALYLAKEDFVKAAQFLIEGKQFYEASNDTLKLLESYGLIASLYFNLGDFNNSYNYYQQAISLDKVYSRINTLGINYSNMGELFLRLENNYDSAVYYYQKGLDNVLEIERDRHILTYNINMGNVFLEQDNIDSSFYFYSLAYNDENLVLYGKAEAAVKTNIGIYYQKKKEYSWARKFLLEGLAISKKFELLNYKQIAFKHLLELEKAQANYEQALDYSLKYLDVGEQINRQEAIYEASKIEFKLYEASEKHKKDLLIDRNKKQTNQIYYQRIIIGIGTSFFIVLAIFLIVFIKKKKEIKTLHVGLSRNYTAMENVNQVLKDQETEMKSMLANKDRFVSILGHDLKNPFSGLLGLLELMDSDWDEMEDKDKKDGIEMLYKTSVQTYQLLEDLLDWGKTQQGLIKSEPDKFELKVLLEGVVSMFDIQSKKKNVSILFDIPEGAQVYTDLKLSSQIIQNFIGNAIKYTHVGGEIFVKVDSEKNNYKINIIDQGIGIPANKIDSLFSLNSHFNRPGTENEKSTGMGLILCKEYAEIIGEELAVTSEEGKGSTFSLIIKKA